MRPVLSVIILSYNRLECLRRNLPSILGGFQQYEYEVVVVDNASSDGSVDFLRGLKAHFPELSLHLNGANLGPGGGRNVGLRTARGEYVLCLDDDSMLDAADIAKIPNYFQTFPDAGILAFRIWDTSLGRYLNDLGETPTSKIANFGAAGFAIRSELLRRIGYMDDLCTFGAEELDFSIRAHAAGFTTLYLPRPTVRHYRSTFNGRASLARDEKWVFNFMRVLFKHFPRPMSDVFACRLFLSQLRTGLRNHGVKVTKRLCLCAYLGVKAGLATYAYMPSSTIKFYQDPDLRPEYGNVPFVRKIHKIRLKSLNDY